LGWWFWAKKRGKESLTEAKRKGRQMQFKKTTGFYLRADVNRSREK